MDDTILNVLTGETVVHANPLATVTRNCLIIRDDLRGTQAVIAIQSVREVRKVNFTNPALLVISAGLFTIAAAAYASHEAYEVSVSLAVIGLLFVFGYFATRGATVLFRLDDQNVESRRGSYRQATSLLRAVKRVNESDDSPSP